MRNQCKECPWSNNNKHNKSWPEYVQVMESIGKVKNKKHACHMITSDVWGYNQEITSKNVCMGSCKTINND